MMLGSCCDPFTIYGPRGAWGRGPQRGADERVDVRQVTHGVPRTLALLTSLKLIRANNDSPGL